MYKIIIIIVGFFYRLFVEDYYRVFFREKKEGVRYKNYSKYRNW